MVYGKDYQVDAALEIYPACILSLLGLIYDDHIIEM